MRYFLCLAEQGNVTRAARQLNIVQPALSMQIARLEAKLGQKLFDRGAQGVTLTAAGAKLAQLVSPILRDAESAKQEMGRLKGRIHGRVSVGVVTSVAQSTLASSAAKIAAAYPDVFMSACEGYTETLADWVTAGQLDIAIINVSGKRSPLAVHHLLDEEMVVAYRADAAHDQNKALPFEHLGRLNLALPSKRHGLRAILDTHAANAGINLTPKLELDNLSALCDLAAATDFVTVLPVIALSQYLTAGTLRARRFVRRHIVRPIAWVHHSRRTVPPAVKAVLDVISRDLADAAATAKSHIQAASAARDDSSRSTR